MALTYRDAGVDMDAGSALVERIKRLAASTHRPEVLGSLGGFAGLCSLPKGFQDPVLVSGTDGVGTKLKLAFAADRHDTIGIDLVAMCVNDVLTLGADPLFFLDYFATGKLDIDRAASVIAGIADGCREAGCALLGGETAELPGFYGTGEYDLAGFVVGVAERSELIDGQGIHKNSVLIALPSSGLHSNGFSLARRALADDLGTLGSHNQALVETLLTPTRIYTRAVRAARDSGTIQGMCHITGGGLTDNLPRILPAGCGAHIDLSSWTVPAIFNRIQQAGEISADEMRRTFNLGVGYIFVVSEEHIASLMDALRACGESPWRLGEVVNSEGVAYS